MKTIGLLLETTEDIFGQETIRGVMEGLAGSGHRLVCFTGGIIRSQFGYEAQRNVLYDLVGRANVDALLLSGVLSHYVDAPTLQAFCQGFAPLPVVTLSVTVPGFQAVVVDDRAGFGALMDHLIGVHGYRRLAYVGGTPGQQEAEERRAVFLEKTSAAGIDVPPGWLYAGDFNRAAGAAAARTFLDAFGSAPGGLPFEAVVVANDSMAMGFQDELRSRGWTLPADLAVTGYDDLPASRIFDPPLTTVVQSLPGLAREGVRTLLTLLDGGTAAPVTRLDPALVVRASCGCRPRPEADEAPGALNACRDELLQEARASAGAWEHLDKVRGLSETLQTSGSREELLGFLGTNLAAAGYGGFWLSLFDDPARPQGTARLFLGRSRGAAVALPPEGLAFPAPELVPGGWAAAGAGLGLFVVEVLHSRTTRLGFLVLETDEPGARVTSTLRSQISGALQAVLLLEERKHAERQLIQSEKMAALGSLVAGVAHEINTPLGVAITASSFLQDQATRFLEKYRDGRASRSDLEAILQDMVHAGDAIQTNLARAADLVSSFKNVSTDQTGELRRTFDLKEYVDLALVSLRFQWKDRPVEVLLEGPDHLVLDSYPGAVAQIVTNLLTNSLIHGFPGGAGGRIRLDLEDRGAQAVLIYSDNGAGNPEEHRNKVFEPFFTTKRGQGSTGLGLHVVYNVVTNLLGGTIGFSSAPGKGTRFEVLLPKKAP